ncbi:FAD-dependent monooxygenase [Sorangium sp. So ce1078]|uniref:FAD-dependent monooxygenase n=1 Tax=Sorangium sp. So ce1078 TaxID=3133329 RepID=UPI003F63CE6C
MDKQVDVVVVGAGPVGLLLAIELKLGGAGVMVLERLTAPSVAIKGTSVGPLGAETLQRRGMGPALAEAEDRTFAAMGPAGVERRAQAYRSRGGHFAVLPLRLDAAREPERRMCWVDQQGLEAILGKRAAALDIEVRRGCEVTDVEQHDDGVAVHWTSQDGPDHARCAWLVGCDGGRSSIRKMAGLAFPGTPPSLTMYQAVLDLDHPERLPRGLPRMREGGFMYGPRPRRLVMTDFSGPPADRKAPVTREELEGVLRRISGADVRVTAIEQANRFTDSARLVDTYRRDRVLLAGDAAHIHSPLGGQGLSLGLVDAANLGWKLAAVVRGDKPDSLLDSYTSERRPVAEAVLANTLAQIALMRPDPHSIAMRDIFAKLLELDGVSGYIDGLMSGLATRYDLGSEQDVVGRLTGDRSVGRADVRTSLFAEMAEGEGILLDASPDGHAAGLAAGFTRVRCLPVDAGPSMLIRPDGCIAWAGDVGDVEGLVDALERWFASAAPRPGGFQERSCSAGPSSSAPSRSEQRT